MLRASPIFCVLDALAIVVRILGYSVRQGSIRDASLTVVTQRFAKDDDDDDDENSSGSFSDFRSNVYFRWAALVFTIAQAVKLYAFEGIIWTKVWASMYFGSFLISELLVVIPSRWIVTAQVHTNGDGPRRSGYSSMPYLSVTASVFFMLYFTVQASTSIFNFHGWRISPVQSIGMVLLSCGVFPFVVSSLYSHFLRTNRSERLQSNLLLLVITVVPGFYLSSILKREVADLKEVYTNILIPLMTGVWVLLSLAWASTTFKAVIGAGRGPTRRVEMFLAWYYFSLHLVSAILYYSFTYDPQGTNTPRWAAYLG